MTSPVRVVVIKSLSYTGTTWLNAVVGSHERAFALGPPERVWQRRNDSWDGVCKVHKQECDFWPGFKSIYDPDKNFFLQLADASGKDVLVINNPVPNGAGTELQHPEIEIRQINLVRDGRAVVASYLRKHPDVDFFTAVSDWYWPAIRNVTFEPENSEELSVRYEDLLSEKSASLTRIGQFVGLSYRDDAWEFWNYSHHFAAGNQGLIALIQRGQHLPVETIRERNFYDQQYQRMKSSTSKDFVDERWRSELTHTQKLAFDVFCGADNARFGYNRERFSLEEIGKYVKEITPIVEKGSVDPGFLNMLPTMSGTWSSRVGLDERKGRGGGGVSVPRLRDQLRLAWLWRHGVTISPHELRKTAAFVRQNGFSLPVSWIRRFVYFGTGLIVVVVVVFSALI